MKMLFMIETSQILIIVAISAMTVILTIIGIQLIFVLADLRKLLVRVNKIVLEFERVGMSLNHGFGEVSGFLSGVKNLFFVFDLLSKKKKKNHDK